MIASSAGVSTDSVERLRRYARFVALIAEQLDAVREDDGERLRRLAEERVALEREFAGDAALEDSDASDEIHSGDSSDETASDGATAEDVLARLHDEIWHALATLEDRFDTDRRAEEQRTLLSYGAIRSARSVPAIRSGGRPYPNLEERPSHLDRRF